MKKRIGFFFLLFSSLLLHSQDTYLKNFGTFYCCGHELRPTKDSGFVSFQRNTLIKLDKESQIQWTKEYDRQKINLEYTTDMASSKEGGFLILGKSQPVNFSASSLVFKTDSLGNVRWTAELAGQGGGESPEAVIETSSGDVLVTSASSGAHPFRANISKLDVNGSLLWNYVYHLPVELYAKNIVEINANRFLVTGTSSNPNRFDYDVHAFMIDAMGQIIWSKIYSGVRNHRITESLKISDNKIMIIGNTGDFGANDRDIFNLQIDTLGNPLGFYLYESPHPSKDVLENVYETLDSELFLMGTKIDTLDQKFSFLLKLDHEGQKLWARSYFGEKSEIFAMTEVPDGGFILNGLRPRGTGETGFLAKLKPNGTSPCISDSVLDFRQHSLSMRVRNTPLERVTGQHYRTLQIPSNSFNQFYLNVCADTCLVGANFLLPTTEACVGSTHSFRNTSNGALYYDWYVNETWVDSLADLSYTFSNPGNYEIKLIAADTLCVDSVSYRLSIISPQELTADFRIHAQLMDVEFKALSSTARTWDWDFGDGSISEFNDPRHVYNELGNYQVCLSTSNVCGTKSSCKNLQIQDTIKAEFQISYARGDWDDNKSIGAAQLIQAKDGSLVVFGSPGSLSKFNTKGELLWNRAISLSTGYGNGYSGISETRDGGFIIGSSRDVNDVTFDEHITLCKTYKDGTIEWVSEFQEKRVDSYVTDIIQTEEGDYVFVGKYGSRGVIGKVGYYGQILWLHGISGLFEGISIEELPSGELIVMGRGVALADIYWGRFSADGQRLWSKGIRPNSGNAQPLHMSKTHDDHYLITGTISSPGLGTFLTKIDIDGNIHWAQSYGSSLREKGLSVHEFPNGEIYLGGGSRYRSTIMKLDSVGNIIWDNKYGLILGEISAEDQAIGGIPTYDGGFVKADMRNIPRNGARRLTLLKVDSEGSAGACLADSAEMMAASHTFSYSSTAIDTIFILNKEFDFFHHTIGNIGGYDLRDSVFCYKDSILINCTAPTAFFSYVDSSGVFQFQNTSSHATSWSWDFGDGSISTAENPQHSFGSPGTYQVCLEVNNTCGSVDIFCENINSNATGFQDDLQFPIRILPNPSSGKIKIQFQGEGKIYNIQLIDLMGKRVWTGNSLIESELILDFSSFASGMYHILIQSSQGFWAKEKLMIMN